MILPAGFSPCCCCSWAPWSVLSCPIGLLQLLVFWELTSLSSFLLIGFRHRSAEARQGARMALTVTGAGGLALLAGFLLLGRIAGSYQISTILGMGDIIRAHPLYVPTLLLILLGAFTKSAQFPFHFWLPQAMAAPTPVSAYLHSATMVKAGVFLLARLFPALSGTDPWFFLVGGTGLLTLLYGAYSALFKHDLKGLLAYSTISHLGLIVLLFGIDTPLAAVAAVFHIINHATFKASLFMAAGIIDHETGTRDMRRINGLWKYMPVSGTLAMVAAAAMAGVPLLNGFMSKEMFFAETFHLAVLGPFAWFLPVAATDRRHPGRRLFGPFHPRCLLQRRAGQPAEVPAARGAPLHDPAGGGPGRPVPDRRGLSHPHGRPLPGPGLGRRAQRAIAGLQPGGLARFQRPLYHEPGGDVRRHPPLQPAP